MKFAHLPVLALAVAMLTVGAAHATTISGTGTFEDNGPSGNGLYFTGSTDNGAITGLNLSVGTPYTVSNFLTISSTDTARSFFGSNETDSISENFNFTSPSLATGSLGGSGTEQVDQFFGFVYGASGTVSWSNPLDIDFADGSILAISLSDVSFGGLLANPDQSVGVNATFDLIQGPGSTSTSVPEPGTLALMAVSLLGLCVLGRRRSRSI